MKMPTPNPLNQRQLWSEREGPNNQAFKRAGALGEIIEISILPDKQREAHLNTIFSAIKDGVKFNPQYWNTVTNELRSIRNENVLTGRALETLNKVGSHITQRLKIENSRKHNNTL